MIIEKAVGDGDSFVYAYYNKNDRVLAEIAGEQKWEHKIGMTTQISVWDRIVQQKTTAYFPIVALLIKTNNPQLIESQLHHHLSSFRVGDTGDEWFMTNSEEIENHYNNIIDDCGFENIGLLILKIRARKGYTQHELAKMSGVSPKTISALENGHRGAKISSVIKILNALKTTLVVKEEHYTTLAGGG